MFYYVEGDSVHGTELTAVPQGFTTLQLKVDCVSGKKLKVIYLGILTVTVEGRFEPTDTWENLLTVGLDTTPFAQTVKQFEARIKVEGSVGFQVEELLWKLV